MGMFRHSKDGIAFRIPIVKELQWAWYIQWVRQHG
jgi:hypothetical protein